MAFPSEVFRVQRQWEDFPIAREPTYEELQQRVKELEKEAVEHKRVEETLRESEGRLQAILDNSTAAIYLKDPHGRYMLANRRFQTLFHIDREGVIGKTDYDIFPKEIADALQVNDQKVLETGSSLEFEEVIPLDREMHTYISIKFPLYDSIRGIYGVCGMSTDITERKKHEEALRQSEEKYSKVVENSLTGIYIDQDERIVFANNRLAEIYRYPREELIGIESWRLVHPEDRSLTDKRRAKRLKGKEVPSEYEARGLTKDGETIWIKRRNTSIEYRGRPAILGNAVDITEKKRAEQELQKLNEELKNFVYVVSHDLKTPIISIQGFSSRLLKDYEKKLGDKGRVYLEHIKSSGRRMEVLVSDLLTLSRTGRVVSEFSDISSWEIVESVASALEDRMKEKGIELVAEELPTISCDGEKIYQVFQNLLVNAIKFMGDTERPQIEVGYADKGRLHQFSVTDNGIGIAPKHHRRIFEMFQRLRKIEDEEGTGLGLAIVDRIVRSHHGKVWVESEKRKGATFYFTLPKDPGPVRDRE